MQKKGKETHLDILAEAREELFFCTSKSGSKRGCRIASNTFNGLRPASHWS
jgi:hypothetical protein